MRGKIENASKVFPVFDADADMWERDGLSLEEEDALVLALWRWYRGRPDTSALTVPAKLVYSPLIARWAASTHMSRAVKNGLARRKARAARNARVGNPPNEDVVTDRVDEKVEPFCEPSHDEIHACEVGPEVAPTSTSTSSSTSSSEKEGARPLAPRCFTPPTEEEVRAFCRKNDYTLVDADRFVAFYASKGWMVGKNKMKDWHAAAKNWHFSNLRGAESDPRLIGQVLHEKGVEHVEADYLFN